MSQMPNNSATLSAPPETPMIIGADQKPAAMSSCASPGRKASDVLAVTKPCVFIQNVCQKMTDHLWLWQPNIECCSAAREEKCTRFVERISRRGLEAVTAV